jgi:selenocysteine-specific elongation factor
MPPSLRRRGAALERAKTLADVTGEPDLVSEVERREVVDVRTLRRIGVPDSVAATGPVVTAGQWLMSAARAERTVHDIFELVREHDAERPLDRGLPVAVLAERLGFQSPELVTAVLRQPLRVSGGRVQASDDDALPEDLERALAELAEDLASNPFGAPTADRLRELGLDAPRIAAAAKAGRLLRLAPGVVLLPAAEKGAVQELRGLPQPFTTSEARARLGTSRRVVLPLLEHLDRARLTRRLPDDRRVVA